MGINRIRDDILFCFIIAFLLSAGAGALTQRAAEYGYDAYVARRGVPDGAVGGKAVDSTCRARSVEDLLSNQLFTVECSFDDAMSYGHGYYGKSYLRILPLDSGEMVAANINLDSTAMRPGTDFLDDDYIMPVGQVVYEDLTKDEKFMSRIESRHQLSRTDFYIDMWGTGQLKEKKDYIKTRVETARVATGVVSFVLLHMLGSGLGVFPYIFAPRKARKKHKD